MHILHEKGGVEVLFTDIEMPGTINGLELAHYVGRKWPATSIVISSGRRLPAKSDLPLGARFLAKPYYPHDLASIAKSNGC
jgi:two-component system, response regulator PdtaR